MVGNVERTFEVLTAHYAGKWPLWLSPRQVAVVAGTDAKTNAAAVDLKNKIRAEGFHVDLIPTSRSEHAHNYVLAIASCDSGLATVLARDRPGPASARLVGDIIRGLKDERESRGSGSVFGSIS